MTTRYKFSSYEYETKREVNYEFTTESDSWRGHDGPMWAFFDFLKGNGFLFDIEAEIGVLKKDDTFVSAADD